MYALVYKIKVDWGSEGRDEAPRAHMRLNSRQLDNLLVIAKHGSFNRAAAELNMSQPALSNSIAELERQVGSRVLDRSARGSQLTSAGRILVRNAEVVAAVLRRAGEELRMAELGIEGPLRIGVVPSLALKLMPAVMSLFAQDHPSVSLIFIEALDDQLVPALQAGSLDIVMAPVSGLYPGPADITESELFDDPFRIGVGPRHPLRNRQSLSLDELRDAAWILAPPGNSYRRYIEALFTTQGIPWPTNCIQTSSLSLIESLLAQTRRVSIITELQSRMQNAWGIKSIHLDRGGSRKIGLKWRTQDKLSLLATQFIEVVRHVVEVVARPKARHTRKRSGRQR